MARRRYKNPESLVVSDSEYSINLDEKPVVPMRHINKAKSIHYNTSNLSFIRFSSILKSMGVKNNAFHLVIYDRALMGVDPFDKNLSTEMKLRIIKECTINFWYFARECVRVPEEGAVEKPGSGAKYAIHRGNAALNYLILNSIDVGIELPRQNFKSVSIDIILLWLELLGTTSTNIAIMNKDTGGSEENIKRMRRIRNCLPEYLHAKKELNKYGELIEITENVKKYYNPHTKNTVSIISTPGSPSAALNAGRGFTAPIIWIDEPAFIKWVDQVINSATPVMSQASISAEKNGVPHSFILSTTPGKLSEEHGTFIHSLFTNSLPWIDKMYDDPIESLKSKVIESADKKENGSPMIYIEYQWYQIGRDQEWWETQIRKNHYNWDFLKVDYLLQWEMSSDNSPFTKEDIEELSDMISNRPITNGEISVETRTYDNKYQFKMYKKVPKDTKVIFGIDVGGGINQDFTVLVVVDAKTKAILGLIRINDLPAIKFADIIIDLMTVYYPNSTWVIENNKDDGLIATLMDKGYTQFLYKQKDIDKGRETLINGFIKKKNSVINNRYGISTTGKSRPEMHEILYQQVVNYKYRIAIPEIVVELKTLVNIQTPSGTRIDHMRGHHDDTIMAYLMAMYILYKGNNIGAYNIITIPDEYCISDDAIEIDEYYAKAMKEESRKRSEMDRLINSLSHNMYSSGNDDGDWYAQMVAQSHIITDKDLMKQEQKEIYQYALLSHGKSMDDIQSSQLGQIYGQKPPEFNDGGYNIDFYDDDEDSNIDPLFFNH